MMSLNGFGLLVIPNIGSVEGSYPRGNFMENFWKKYVTYRNMKFFTRTSPTHERFPVKSRENVKLASCFSGDQEWYSYLGQNLLVFY